jgi:hypothetical protein
VFLEYRHHDDVPQNTSSGLRPDTPPTPRRTAKNLLTRSPLLKRQ